MPNSITKRPSMIKPFAFRTLSRSQRKWIRNIMPRHRIRRVRKSQRSRRCRIWHSLIFRILSIWISCLAGWRKFRNRNLQIIRRAASSPRLSRSRKDKSKWSKRAWIIRLRISRIKKCKFTSLKSLKVEMPAAALPHRSWARHQCNQDKESSNTKLTWIY